MLIHSFLPLLGVTHYCLVIYPSTHQSNLYNVKLCKLQAFLYTLQCLLLPLYNKVCTRKEHSTWWINQLLLLNKTVDIWMCPRGHSVVLRIFSSIARFWLGNLLIHVTTYLYTYASSTFHYICMYCYYNLFTQTRLFCIHH